LTTMFWDVDTQLDFFEGGKLIVPNAEAIRENLRVLTCEGLKAGVTMAGSADAHTPMDREFQVWGEHCVYGTPGQSKISETRLGDLLFVPSRKLTNSQLEEAARFPSQVIFEKQVNDVRSNHNARHYINTLSPENVVVYGVVTEVCVDLAVQFLAGDLGYSVTVVSDAIKDLDSSKAKKAKSSWNGLGVNIATTNEVLTRSRIGS
jgi:nicotinamidase/pyrazinamidase